MTASSAIYLKRVTASSSPVWDVLIGDEKVGSVWFVTSGDEESYGYMVASPTTKSRKLHRTPALAVNGIWPGLKVKAWKPTPPESPTGRWQCSGCDFRTDGPIGDCKGYCFDASGDSCDAVPCPRCGNVHYWTGSIAEK